MALNTKGKKTSLTEEASIYQKRQDDLSDKERIKNMTGKQKRYLRSLAATMPPVVQIGKNGLENSVIDSARAALMARELIKVRF